MIKIPEKQNLLDQEAFFETQNLHQNYQALLELLNVRTLCRRNIYLHSKNQVSFTHSLEFETRNSEYQVLWSILRMFV